MPQDKVLRNMLRAFDTNDPAAGWISVFAASAILFVGVGYTNTFGVFQDYYQTTLFPHEPGEKIVVVGSTAASLYFILGALTGRLADFVGYRFNIILGSVLMIGSMFAASACSTFWQIYLSQGLMFGVGVAFVYPPATSVSRQYFGQEKHGLTNGIVVSGGALGGCILPYLTRLMIQSIGLAQTFRVMGYIAAGVLIPSAILIKPKPRSGGSSTRRGIIDMGLLSDRRFLILTVACTIAMAGFLPRYFLIPASAQFKGIGKVYASWLLGIMNGLSIIGRIGIGCTADRIGPLNALAASFSLCALSHFAFWIAGVANNDSMTSTALLTMFVIFVGLFGSGFISLFPVVVANIFGHEDLASKTGLLNSFVGLSTLAGPSAVYAIVDQGGVLLSTASLWPRITVLVSRSQSVPAA